MSDRRPPRRQGAADAGHPVQAHWRRGGRCPLPDQAGSAGGGFKTSPQGAPGPGLRRPPPRQEAGSAIGA
eukprot:9293479-Pyramimonas_sp.AAC.1